METITRNVRDLGAGERFAVEQLVGHQLSDEQKLIIQVANINLESESAHIETDLLPDWCNVYEGMTDDEIAEIEKSIVRCDVSRTFK